MKKLFSLFTALVIFASSFTAFPIWNANAQAFPTVLEWMFSNGLTRYDQVDQFRPYDSITRGEAAKFVNSYAQLIWAVKNYNQCAFSDIEWYDYTLVPHILEACQYGLLKGSQWRFMPNNGITEAQAITVVMRTLSWFMDETKDLRRRSYAEAGRTLGILGNENMQQLDSVQITRQKLGTRFYKAAQLSQAQMKQIDWDAEVRALLKETFGSDYAG